MDTAENIKRNESLDEQDARFAFGAAVAGAVAGMLGLAAALLAWFISWPDVSQDAKWVSITYGFLQASGLLLLIGLCTGIIAIFAPGLPRRLGLLVAFLCAVTWASIYLYTTWPTANTLVGAAEKGDWNIVKLSIAVGVDPEATADPDRWDPRYGFDESGGKRAIELAIERDHMRVVRVLQEAGVRIPEGYQRMRLDENAEAAETDQGAPPEALQDGADERATPTEASPESSGPEPE